MLSLQELEAAYPELNPYFGTECIENCDRSIILIGESHYLPKETRCDTTPTVWYSGQSVLDDTDRYWINTAGILNDEIPTGLKNRAHSIWKLSALSINHAGPKYVGSACEVLTNVYKRLIAFNFFMRPAKEGDTLKWQLDKADVEIARERVARLLAKIHSQGIIILSSCVADNFDFQMLSRLDIPYVCTPHPGCVWWNRRSRRSNYKTGSEIIGAFVRQIDFK